MIRLGARLALAGGREAVVRLVVIAASVALGVGVLLVSLAGINAVNAQGAHTAWLTTSIHNKRPGPAGDPLWAMARLDQFRSAVIERVDVAATGPRSPVPPGIPRLPGPGEFYASPALARLLATTPRAELGDRYPGVEVGTIGRAALASPSALVIVVGDTATSLSQVPGAAQITSFETAAHGAPGDAHPGRMQFILAVVAGSLLIPVLIFIGAATRLSAARREQRFAAMRLLGAAPRQVSVLAAVEAVLAATAGVAGGFGVFVLMRPLVARIPFTGQPFFPSDLSLHAADVGAVVVGIPVAAAVVARVALRRVQISPLGVSRRVTPPNPGPWRVAPLLAGVAELAYFVGRRPGTTNGQVRAYGAGFLLALVGLVVAGPYLTMFGARILARRARRPATLLAGRRLADNPRAAFRAVSGLVVALFICSAALGMITTVLAYQSTSTGGAAARDIVTEAFGRDVTIDGRSLAGGEMVTPQFLAQLAALPGVRAVLEIHVDPSQPSGPQFGPDTGLVACSDLAEAPVLGRCPAGATVASVPWTLSYGGITSHSPSPAQRVWPAATAPGGGVASLPAAALDVATDGSSSAIERTRTSLEVAFPNADTPTTVGDISAANVQLVTGWRQLAAVAIVASLVIAACSLAVSVAGGLVDRKRPFSQLRLAGTPLGVLRRVVAFEAAVPLLLVAAAAASTGLLAAHLFLRSQLGESLQPPGAAYYVAVSAGLGLALAIIAATLPLLERITGPEAARNE